MKTIAITLPALCASIRKAANEHDFIVRDNLPADIFITSNAEACPDNLCNILVGRTEIAALPFHISHIVSENIDPEDLISLIRALIAPSPRRPPALPIMTPEDAQSARLAFEAVRHLAGATDLVSSEAIIETAITELLNADASYCLFYDATDGSLWSERTLRSAGDNRRAVAGIAGFTARTAIAVNCDRAQHDPRFNSTIDHPNGDRSDRIATQAVIGTDGTVQAILIATRRARRAVFNKQEATLLARFAALTAATLDQVAISTQAEMIIAASEESPFNRDAVMAQKEVPWGEVLQIAPGWIKPLFWLLVALLVVVLATICIIKIPTYSSGVAIVQSASRTQVTSHAGGNVKKLLTAPGEHALPDTAIALLDDSEQQATLAKVSLEYEAQLRKHLLDPSNPTADSAVSQLRTELASATLALEQRYIRAGALGTVGDLRIRPGQHIEAGDPIASIADPDKGLDVIALLPGEDRPKLHENLPMRLELVGYRYSFQTLRIDHISSDIISPGEARRILGADIADGIAITGPVVIVRGHLPYRQFTTDEYELEYHNGMVGRVDIKTRSERLLFALFPTARSF